MPRSPRKSGSNPTPKSPPRINPSIKKDAVKPSDFLNYDFRFACEECSHFDTGTDGLNERCTLGYNAAHHRKSEQTKQYLLSGKMALCRFHEID